MKAQIEKIAAIQQLIDSCDWYLDWYEANTKGFLQLYYAQKIAKYTDIKEWLQNRLYANIITLYNMTPKEHISYVFKISNKQAAQVNTDSAAKRLAKQYPDCEVDMYDMPSGYVVDTCLASDIFDVKPKSK